MFQDVLDSLDNKEYSCPGCGWSGKKADMESRYVNTSPESWMALAGREGYEYLCPSCGWMITSNYWKMS